MKKSFIKRTLQFASAITVYSATSVWASTNHVDIVSNTIANINSLLVILAIAFALPYFCFKVLGKLYTPPVSRNPDNAVNNPELNQDELAIADNEDFATMQYRGSRYSAENLTVEPSNINVEKNDRQAKPAIKYRGVSIANSVNNTDSSTEDVTDSFSSERKAQKSAKPKERMKYRGSYID
ncbi:MAG: hypothetical protein DCF19_03570 [Pseudanabaena frigida]|uniref:Uncharacterized protein n=1 Tax=Pseudanabaena frigida TaxID=945775 RepID=A0A2W4Y8F2_9CYAN|nr:MAG: hypothetical protein DCF19_03570 [Pseudanabaena frigida]